MTPTEPSYFDLMDDMSTDQRWYLDGPAGPGDEWLGTALVCSQRYGGPTPLTCRIHHQGPPLELTITQETVPVVNDRVAELISKHAREEIQLLPVEVAGAPGRLWAVNTLAAPDCVDEARTTEVHRYTKDDGRPDRIGQYRAIYGLRIDPARTGSHAIFRPHDWDVTVIIGKALADDLLRAGVRCRLTPVS